MLRIPSSRQPIPARPFGQVLPEHLGDYLGLEAVVAGRHRGVGGEDAPLPHRLDVGRRRPGHGPAEPLGQEGHGHQ